MPEPPKSGSAVTPSRPSAPSSFQRCAGNSFERSMSAARGAIFSCAKRRTMSRRLSISSPWPKSSVFRYICFLPAADQPHRHGEIGFRDILHRKPLARPEPDDNACDHLNDSHRSEADVVDGEGAAVGAIAQDGAQLLFIGGAKLQHGGEIGFGKAAQLHVGDMGRVPASDVETDVMPDEGSEAGHRIR